VSIFKFERSALRRLGRSFWSEDEVPGKAPRPSDSSEDQSDPYLSQTASFLTGRKLATPGDSNDIY
jgi:hypothetical protein